jgi:hypothetical protein
MRALTRKRTRWIGPTRVRHPETPVIRSHELRRNRPELHLRVSRRDDARQLVLPCCRSGTLDTHGVVTLVERTLHDPNRVRVRERETEIQARFRPTPWTHTGQMLAAAAAAGGPAERTLGAA